MEKSPKKWSLGNILFRKSKKDIPQADFSSDEDDRKAGFGNDFIKKSPAKVKSNKYENQQYSVANPEFHYFKPTQQQHQQQQQYFNGVQRQPQVYQNDMEFINNQINLEKNRLAQPQYIYSNNNNYLHYQGSSQDEKSSYNSLSSPINKSGSENGSRTSLNKKTRSARNERYYQRILRDDGRPVTVYGSVNSIENNQNKYQAPLNTSAQNRLSASLKSSSICSSEFMNPVAQSQSLPITRYRVNVDKDDYENIHEESGPPPIPPRDPNRRFSINSSLTQNPYYFDQALQKYVIFNANGKCFSDDKLWKNESEHRPVSSKIEKFEMSAKQQHDILRPRSRKPLNLNTNLENESVFSSEDVVDNPRQYPISQRSKSAIDFERLMNGDPKRIKYPQQRARNLTSVEPIKYQHPSNYSNNNNNNDDIDLQALRKKYSSAEDVNKNKVNLRQKVPTAVVNNTPCSRKSLNDMNELKVKESSVSSNLDDAINELELMYKSLVKDETLMERAARRDIPTPTKFSQLMRKYEEYENEENRNEKEPDIVLDDVFSRNLKHANHTLKKHEQQPPFGIPNQKLYPIPTKVNQHYLSIEPVQLRKSIMSAQNNPDLVADDLAVRNLRKDNPNYNRRNRLVETENNHFMKRNHTLSSLSEHIYNGILKDSAKPSGGNLGDYLNYDLPKTASSNGDVKSTLYLVKNNNNNNNERADFEESLNALVIESKAISQKLEKDLSKLKRESVTPKPVVTASQPKTLVTLLDFRKSMEREKQKDPVEEKPKMTSTACSPITDLDISCPPKEELIKSQAPKQQKAEKIENLIKMFNNTALSPPAEQAAKKIPAKVIIEKPSRKLSDLSNMFEKAPEVDTKPPTQPTSSHTVKKASSAPVCVEEKPQVVKMISPRIVSPTIMGPRVTSPPKVVSPAESNLKPQTDVESNINNIKELIQQIKLTEFEKNKRDAMKPVHSDLPDYDNIKDDYEMTDGKLERIAKAPVVPVSLEVIIPSKESKESSEVEENSPEIKSITTTSSSLRETSVESSSKESSESARVNDSAAIYKDAMEFLQETADPQVIENEHKSPIKSIRQDKEAVLNYIERINENLDAVKVNEEQREEASKMSVKESVTKLEQKLSLSRQASDAVSETTSEASHYTTPPKEPSTPVQIKPVVLPKVGPSDTESLYNSSEELSMIFGNAEHQQSTKNVPMHPDSTILELEKKLLDATAKFNANNSAKCNNNNTSNAIDSCILSPGRAVMCKYLADDDDDDNVSRNNNINNNVKQCNVMHLQSSIASPQQQPHLDASKLCTRPNTTDSHCSRVKYLNNCRSNHSSNLCKTTADPTVSPNGNSTLVVNAMSRSSNLLKNFL